MGEGERDGKYGGRRRRGRVGTRPVRVERALAVRFVLLYFQTFSEFHTRRARKGGLLHRQFERTTVNNFTVGNIFIPNPRTRTYTCSARVRLLPWYTLLYTISQ